VPKGANIKEARGESWKKPRGVTSASGLYWVKRGVKTNNGGGQVTVGGKKKGLLEDTESGGRGAQGSWANTFFQYHRVSEKTPNFGWGPSQWAIKQKRNIGKKYSAVGKNEFPIGWGIVL